MIVHPMPVGPLQANCFIVGCDKTRKAAIIDPGGDADRLLSVLERESLELSAIINTHGHFDHVGGNKAVKAATGADLMIHREDAPMLAHLTHAAAAWGLRSEESPPPDRLLEDGDLINFGNLQFKVIHTPGHSPGGICLHVESEQSLFVGDTLFAGSIGRTDLPGGDYDTLIRSIQTRLFVLPDETAVYNGHMEPTTIGQEKRFNPFCKMV
jgi:glyoxylase-like metal-dependent hydrolase (beta-lactamase superfamily II)